MFLPVCHHVQFLSSPEIIVFLVGFLILALLVVTHNISFGQNFVLLWWQRNVLYDVGSLELDCLYEM